MTTKKGPKRFPNGSEVHVIEGLISSGKSTLIRSLQKSAVTKEFFDEVIVFDEPIKKRTLDAYLDDQTRYSFSFQTNTAIKRGHIFKEALRIASAKPRILVLIDRGLDGDQAFALAQLRLEYMTPEDYSLYQEEIGVDDGSLEKMQSQPGFRVVYLRCEPRTSWKRTLKRGIVKETATYDENYMSTVHAAHEEMLADKPHVTTLDWEQDRSVVGGILDESDVRAYFSMTT